MGLEDRGFVVFPAVAPEPLLEAARAAITSFLGVELDRPETWYPAEPLDWSVVPIHHPQAFWDLRQHPAVHQVFAGVRGTERLWVSMDRGIYKVPASDQHPDHVDESRIHWDLDPRTLRWPSFQGMLFLTDTGVDQGPFECVPSISADLDRFLATHPGDDALDDLEGHEVVKVPARAGDLVVWDSRLPHHGGRNTGRAPRLSVAIAMWPEGDDAERAERIACWRDKRPPACWRGWRGQVDPEPGEPAILTDLGRKLLGLDRW
jgi:hypothetical protein